MVAPAFFAAMNSKQERTALITGATTGIGYELAKLFAADGWRLVLVARNKKLLGERAAELQKLGSPVVTYIAKDLADLEAPEELYEDLQKRGIKIDALVNNAGFGVRGAFSKTSLDDELDMIQLNVVALTHLTKLFLPQMIARNSGKILQVASTAGFFSGPFMAVYYATKNFVVSFSEALHEELKGTGVTVTTLCPGATETPFADRAKMRDTNLFKGGTMDAASVAREGYSAMMSGKSLIITGIKNRLNVLAGRIAPRSTVRKIIRAKQE